MVSQLTSAPAELMTAEEFYDWAHLPENDGRWYELEDGRVIEMPPPQYIHGTISSWIVHLLWNYAIACGRGHVTSNDTGIIVRRRPDTVCGADIMYFAETIPLQQMPKGYAEDTPRLIVEVYSPSDRPGKLSRRIRQYQAKGVPLLWVVYPEDSTVDVYRLGEPTDGLVESDTLDGGTALPDFKLSVADLFKLPGTLT